MENSVLILAVNSSTQDLMSSIRSFKAAGVKNIMMLDSAKYGFVPVMDPSVRLFHTDKALLDVLGAMDGFVYVTKRISAPKDFIQAVFDAHTDKGTAYGISGFQVMEPPSNKNRMAKIRVWSRGPNSPRYLKGDSGDEPVDFFTDTGFLLHSSAFARICKRSVTSTFDDPKRASMAFMDAGMPMVCMDTGWGRPVRLTTKNTSMKTVTYAELTMFRRRNYGITGEPIKSQKVTLDPVDEVDMPPTLPVVFLTHNRTAVACKCLEALCKNLSYIGKIRFCICDDRSEPGHVEALEMTLLDNGISDYVVKRTTSDAWGLGASMNNGLREAFSLSPVVLTSEDDFLLVRKFDATEYVGVLMKNSVAGIRLAHVNTTKNGKGMTCTSVSRSSIPGFWKVSGGNRPSLGEHYTFNNQVMLRHRRIYDLLGMYMENVRAETVETDMCRKYSMKCNDGRGSQYMVLYPSHLPLNSLANGLLTHIGLSTMNHGHRVPPEFMSLNDNKTDETIRSKALGLESDKKYRFHIVTPFYNCSSLLSRCLACVNGQTIDKSKICMTVIDDASDMDESYRAKTMCSKYGFVSYVRSPERVNTGGAKNIGINKNVNCDYIVFLDADDTFMDERCLERLDKELEESGGPDVMLCGFVFGDSGKSRMFSATTPKAMSEANCIAPWMRVATPAKTGLFNEKRRVASDVTHYLRQLDSVSTVASLSFPLIRYAKDNPNSAWASKKVDLSKDVIRAKFLLMSDMMTERFVHEYTRKAAVRQMKYEYNVSLKEAMDSIKEGTFE